MNYILVITEDASVSRSLKAVLREEFLMEEVKPCDAAAVVSARRPAVVFLDSLLTDMDSLEVLKSLLAGDPTLTVIKLVDSFNRIGREAINSGAFDILEKSYEPERMKHVLRKALEREELMQDKRKLQDRTPVLSAEQEISEDKSREDFFQNLFQTIAENFPDMEKIGMDVLKILKKKFYFNNIVLFLMQEKFFSPFVSLGIDETVVKKIKIPMSHSLITWFMNKNRILNIFSDKDIPFECFNFMNVLKSCIALPLKTVNGKLIGFLAAGNKFTGQGICISEISFLNIIADYLAAILDNAFLYREITFQKEYQEAIFQNIPTGIIGVDREGKIVICNLYAEELFGLKPGEVQGQDIEKTGSQIADFVRRTLDSGEIFTRAEIRYIPKNIILGISTNVIREAEGKTEGAVAIFQNLTAIKEMEAREKALEKNKYWTALASRLSHELKNPLVAIKTFAQMLPDHYDDEEFRTSFSDIVQSEVKKINGIIDKINRLADSMELKKERIDIVQLFRESINAVPESKNFEVEIEDKKPVFIEGDVLKLKEAVAYIFDFIREDAGAGGEIGIFFKDTGTGVEVNVTESGGRVDFQASDDFFMPFNNSVIGSPVSIGVMFAKKVIESHGGSLFFSPVPGGKQLTFIFPRGDNNG